MSRADPAPLTGRTLGDFVVREKLGEGGHGVVYRAEQRTLGREAVVKVLRTRRADERVVARFLREAQLASKLDHPYAAHVYAFGAEPDGVMWIAMELVRGTPLSKVLATQPAGRMPIARWVGLLDRICEVVHTAHEQGIVHRDLKPDNIMVLSRAGRLIPKLLDLGVAKLTVDPTEIEAPTEDRDGRDVRLTQDGARVGSPFYMAPEQWSDGEIDARTDLYALGVITYEALVGRAPFEGATVTEIARAHLRGEPAPLPADLPPAVGDAIRAALAKDRGARPATALAFAEAIRAASGLRVAAEALPRLDEGLRADVAWLPQPIAEAIGAIEAARNPHQARDALWEIVRVAARWLGVVALAARSRSGPGPGLSSDAPALVDLLRVLPRRELTDEEWLELVRALARPFAAARDAHPIPELVDLAMAEVSPFAPLLSLRAADVTETSEESLRDWLARTLPVLTPLVRALGFLTDYQLVVRREAGGEVWMGARRPRRAMIHVAGDVPIGAPVLVDFDARPVLALSPLVAIAPPSPGAADEIFLFAGPGRARGRGARLIAEPHGFERHDDGVWDWFRAHLFALDDESATRSDEVAPYRGLAAFTEKDAGSFFGRERQAEAFLNQLLVTPLLAVVGPSGTGKSSFVQAGVVPSLPPGWRAVTLRPGAAPMSAWAARVDLSSLQAGETLVIVVDQFEEVFTLCADPDQRDRFARALVDAVAGEHVRVVLTLRDDFLARAGELAPLRDRLALGLTLLATPAHDDLLRIVVEPARRAGYDFDEQDLPPRMVRAVAGQPGALALLSFTAAQLWELRDRHFKRLTRKAYDAIGGVEGALAAHADATLAASTAEEQRLMRDAFRHLVTAEGTRAVLTRAELHDVLGKSPHAAAAIERLVKARLLVASEDDHVEIIHEALIAAWPRLVGWRRDDAEGARMRDQVRAAARQWADRDRARGLLWRDDALEDYRRWRARWPGALPELDEAFAAASLKDAARGRRLRRTLAITAATILLAATTALALLYRSSRDNARESHDRLIESYVEQGRRLLVDGDYLRALPYLSAAYTDGDSSLAVRMMLHRAMRLADMPTFAKGAVAVTFTDPDHLVTVSDEGTARAITISTGQLGPQMPLPDGDSPVATQFAPISRDGQTAFRTRQHVMVWDGKTMRALPVAAATLVALDSTGARVAISTANELSLWSVTDERKLWSRPLATDALQIQPIGDAIVLLDGDGNTHYLTASASIDLGAKSRIGYGSAVAFATLSDRGVEVWHADGTLAHAFELPAAANVTVSPDGTRVAVGTASGVISLFDVPNGRSAGTLPGHRGLSRSAFSRDGQRLVSVGEDQTVRVWSVARPGQLQQLIGTGNSATGISFDPSGTRVVVANIAGVRIFDTVDPSAIATIDAGAPQGTGAFMSDGRSVFTTTDTAVETWDASSGRRLAHYDTGPADGAHFDARGSLLAIPLVDAPVTEVRDVATGAVRARLTSKTTPNYSIFDHAGRRVLAATSDGTTDVWNVDGTHHVSLRGGQSHVMWAAFDPSDRRIATAQYADRTVTIFDASTYREIARARTDDAMFTVGFDASGDRLLTATDNRYAQLWDSHTMRLIRTFEHETTLRGAAISGDARVVAGATRDGTVSIWDADGGKELYRFHHAGIVMSVDFASDGLRLLSTGQDDLAMVWDVDRDVPDPAAVAAFVACHVPYALHGTSLDVAALKTCR